jgi:biotin transport system substrate-specific component
MILSSYIRIPLLFSPVPITMQTFVLYLSILFLKEKAIFSQVIYIILGLGGMPVFSRGGAGLIYLLGPTGGYIVGFLAVALIFPHFLPKERSFLRIFSLFVLANILIYTIGVSWLVLMHKFTFDHALFAGVYPFIIGDVFKIALVSLFSLKGYHTKLK